jgi:YVTN family beta-propeller protein
VDLIGRRTVQARRLYPRALKLSRDGRRLYAYSPQYPVGDPAGPTRGRLFILDPLSLETLDWMDLGWITSVPGTDPQIALRIVLNADETVAYLTNASNAEVIAVDMRAKKIAARIAIGDNRDRSIPTNGLALTPDGSRLFATDCISHSVAAINTSQNAVIAKINVGGVS